MKYDKTQFMDIMNTIVNYENAINDSKHFLEKQGNSVKSDFFGLMGEAMQFSYTPFVSIITSLLDNMYGCDDLISWWYDEVFFWGESEGIAIKEHGNEYNVTPDIETLWDVIEKEYL